MKAWVAIPAACAIIATPALAAETMSVATFLAKAEALRKKGPLALFSGDLKLLTSQMKGDAAAIRSERLAAEKAGKPRIFCPPVEVKLTDKDVLQAMEAVPAPRRAATSTRQALRAYMVRRYPCKS